MNSTTYRPLRRSRTNRKIAGVCAGVARYLRVDPNVVRLVFVLTVIFSSGWALLAYPIMWALMPQEESVVPVAVPASPPFSSPFHPVDDYQPPTVAAPAPMTPAMAEAMAAAEAEARAARNMPAA